MSDSYIYTWVTTHRMIDPLENTKHENSKSIKRKRIWISACKIKKPEQKLQNMIQHNDAINPQWMGQAACAHVLYGYFGLTLLILMQWYADLLHIQEKIMMQKNTGQSQQFSAGIWQSAKSPWIKPKALLQSAKIGLYTIYSQISSSLKAIINVIWKLQIIA